MSQWYPGWKPADQFDLPRPPASEAYPPWTRAPYPGLLRSPDPGPAGSDPAGSGTAGPDTRFSDTARLDTRPWRTRPGGREPRGALGWLVPVWAAVAVAAVGVVSVLLASAHSSGQHAGGFVPPSVTPAKAGSGTSRPGAASSGSGAAGPLTLAEARSVVASYTKANNAANAARSDALLAMTETGSSYTIDAGLYQTGKAAGVAPYAAFTPVQATYFIPRDEPAAQPRWFAVQVANAFLSSPRKVTSVEYLLFTQASPGGPWRNAIEPYVLPGASAPRIAVGADGLATAVSPDAAAVTVAPGQLATATAASLNGSASSGGAGSSGGTGSSGGAGSSGGTGSSGMTGQAAIADPGNLADQADQRYWQAKVPGGDVTDAHTPAAGANGQEFALLTASGGALVFYTDTAGLTITPAAGSALHLSVPGLYSPTQALAQAKVGYLEQFAAYDPPTGDGAPTIVADYSAITPAITPAVTGMG